MKKEDVGEAVQETRIHLGDSPVGNRNRTALLTDAEISRVVFVFLTRLIGRSGYLGRQVLRIVRGLVADWMRSRGIEVPGVQE